MEEVNPRVRMNVKQNAKGKVQFDCTVESSDVDSSVELLKKALSTIEEKIKEAGYALVEE